jgi:creatinine amidohydrolase/Fe(II)-dependent formamide hydrolase-like protein
MSRNIVRMTRDEVAEQIARNPVAVMPFGSIEQHGPHFPTSRPSSRRSPRS